MLNITFKGIKPEKNLYSYSVVGNAEVDVIKFILTEPLDSVNTLAELENFDAYVKVESAGKGYLDKISVESSYVEVTNAQQEVIGHQLEVEFTLQGKTTQFRNLMVQLQFEKVVNEENLVSQTEIVNLSLSGNIDADNELPNVYPNIIRDIYEKLADHERRISALE
jgi:hypothetical protein